MFLLRAGVAVLCVSLVLAGCATHYQRFDGSSGYSETYLRDNIYRIDFAGNQFTSVERTRDFVMLRAAELTLKKGYRYFGLMDSELFVEQYSDVGHVHVDVDNLTELFIAVAVSILTFSVLFGDRPTSSITVAMMTQRPPQAPADAVLDARVVFDDLTRAYRLRPR